MDKQSQMTMEEGIESGQDMSVADFPWVLFAVNKTVYGIHSSHVLSIESLGHVTPLVDSARYIRGMANFRGDMISLIDLRTLFGLPGRYDEYSGNIVGAAVSSHENWVYTLRECMDERKPFPLAIDPHNCAFGKWYYSLNINDGAFASYVRTIEAPHERLHKTGGKIMELIESGDYEEAETLMKSIIEPTFAEIMKILGGMVDAFKESHKEMLVVIEIDGKSNGLIVDEIVSVEYINRMMPLGERAGGERGYVRILAKRDKDNSIVQILDDEMISAL